MDKAHIATDEILISLEKELAAIFRDANKNIRKDIFASLDKLYLDDSEATPRQRLKYAEKSGKDEIIKKYVDCIVDANKKTVEAINHRQAEIYLLNFLFAADEIIRQLQGGG